MAFGLPFPFTLAPPWLVAELGPSGHQNHMPHAANTDHIAKLQKILDDLFAVEPVSAGSFKSPQRGVISPTYAARQYQGIYVFTDEADEEVIYIGKTNDGTKKKGMADRIWGHLDGGSAIEGIVPKEQRTKIKVRTLREDDPHTRGCAELYGIAVYRPKANRISKTTATIQPAQA